MCSLLSCAQLFVVDYLRTQATPLLSRREKGCHLDFSLRTFFLPNTTNVALAVTLEVCNRSRPLATPLVHTRTTAVGVACSTVVFILQFERRKRFR